MLLLSIIVAYYSVKKPQYLYGYLLLLRNRVIMILQRLKCLVYDIVLWAVKLEHTEIKKKTLLLIKTNRIGDYILWRNMLPYIRQSEKFKDYNITFLGSTAIKSLFKHFDDEFVDNTIWVDMDKFKSNIIYRYKMLKEIRKRGFEVVVNTIESRSKREDDAFVIACSSKTYTIGQQSDDTNVFSFEINYDKGLYKKLFTDYDENRFAFKNNVLFTQFFLNETFSSPPTFQLATSNELRQELRDIKYFVVFTGSSSPNKIWDAQKFAHVCRVIVKMYNWKPVLCGSNSDRIYVDNFLTHYNDAVIDLCGKTSLVEFAVILKNAQILLSIDTGAVHIAAATGTTVFTLNSGIHYGRFSPYPSDIRSNIYGIYPDVVDGFIKEYERTGHFKLFQIPEYNEISAEKVSRIVQNKLLNIL